ncbi:hypothetical protein Poli38472_008871 [Pythium oligandrum]|uniref:Autophagy-related protein 6 n=1 Tax=Pythium oligandrum TaxID=41045 RepID=A0A8K1C4E5_PYTOL|nr:hypothetical protein Poli38472_008871 [Pythium oligandrum]|eukprot:TMW56223.1 hypothetical protein Poli38472_008871 [Pythium oligandrum]
MRHAFVSLTQSTLLQEQWESTMSFMSGPFGTLDQHARLTATNGASSDGTSSRRPPTSMAESMIAVATHANLSDQVQRLSVYHAHCAGLPVTTPACKECVDTMLEQIDGQVERTRHDKRSFASFLQTTGTSVRNEEVEHIQEKIQFYEDELHALEENLSLMSVEREEIQSRQKSLDVEYEAIVKEEDAMWQAFNDLQFNDSAFRDRRDSASVQLETLERMMETTRAHSVLTEAYVIGQTGPFGVINGFRMGQMPTVHVEWNEINAAFGECALLLHTLAGIVGLEFTGFKIVPLGSFSKIVRLSSLRMEYSLHGSDQDNFAESRFNLGLGAWITCVGQLLAHVESQDRTLKLPYKISKHSINGYSVLYLKNKHSEWTKALRYTLTNLKWLLKWVSTRYFSTTIAGTP